MIRFFHSVRKEDIPLVGGKGANLGEMYGRFPVPNGFVVTTNAYRRFVDMRELKEDMSDLLQKLDVGDHKNLNLISGKLKKLIMDEDILDEIVREIEAAMKKLKGTKFAVRSSATAEDLITASFAGQQDTYLNVKRQDIVNAVKKCWSSLFNPRAIYYRHEKKVSRDVAMAVVVQEMIDAEIAGVMFTVDPIRKKYILVEAAHGLGEQVVSGQVTPSSFMFERKTFELKEKNITYDIEEGLMKKVAKLGLLIEAHYGRPQDIEFAIKDGKLHILQSRAITTL